MINSFYNSTTFCHFLEIIKNFVIFDFIIITFIRYLTPVYFIDFLPISYCKELGLNFIRNSWVISLEVSSAPFLSWTATISKSTNRFSIRFQRIMIVANNDRMIFFSPILYFPSTFYFPNKTAISKKTWLPIFWKSNYLPLLLFMYLIPRILLQIWIFSKKVFRKSKYFTYFIAGRKYELSLSSANNQNFIYQAPYFIILEKKILIIEYQLSKFLWSPIEKVHVIFLQLC